MLAKDINAFALTSYILVCIWLHQLTTTKAFVAAFGCIKRTKRAQRSHLSRATIFVPCRNMGLNPPTTWPGWTTGWTAGGANGWPSMLMP